MPAVLRLYARLRARGGQAAAYLVRIATDLLNDYRHEVSHHLYWKFEFKIFIARRRVDKIASLSCDARKQERVERFSHN